MAMANSHSLMDTKIPADSLMDTPDPTTMMLGMNICSLQWACFYCCLEDKGNYAVHVADISTGLTITV